MEIYGKVRGYLYNNIGHLTTTGTPRFDIKEKIWKVAVLCKTERGIIIAGEFHVNKADNFVNMLTTEETTKTVELQAYS